MFLTVNKLKGLIIDLNSIPKIFDSEWRNFKSNHETCFIFSGMDAGRLENIKSINRGFQVYNETPFHPGVFHLKKYKQILLEKGLHAYETAAVLGNTNALCQALNANIASILLTKDQKISRQLMDLLPDHIAGGAEEINGILSLQNVGYFAEHSSEKYAEKATGWGAARVLKAEFSIEQFPPCNLIAAGRYFSQSDPRAYGHQLSKRILLHKREETAQTEIFKEIYRKMIEKHIMQRADAVTRIPPKDARQFDRFRKIVSGLAETMELEDLAEELVCTRKYGSQRRLNLEERAANVRDAFKIEADLQGKHVLLLDDIITSGATVKEAARQMYQRGAEKVTVVVLAVKQRKNNFLDGRLVPVKCRKCGGELQLRVNRLTHEATFGCKELYNKEKPCTYIEGYKCVMERRNLEADQILNQILRFS